MPRTNDIVYPLETLKVWGKYWRITILSFWKDKFWHPACEYQCECWRTWIGLRNNIVHWQDSCKFCKHYHIKHWFCSRWWDLRFYKIYLDAVSRCTNPNDTSYDGYWLKWIKVLWNTFEEFKDDMYESYLQHCEEYSVRQTTLDRIDSTWNYCKENCRRATYLEQWNNTSRNIKIEYNWNIYTLKDIIKMTWLSQQWVQSRIYKYRKWRFTLEQIFAVWKLSPRIARE